MKIPILACLLLVLSYLAQAQKKVAEFGDIGPSELRLKECPFEKGAAAMTLLKTGKVTMEVDEFSGKLAVTTDYRVRIKVFDRRGFSAANIRIPFPAEGRSSKITNIEAYIYFLDPKGKVARERVEKSQIFRDKSRASNSINYVSFTFPDLYDGAVLEYEYTLIEKNARGIQPWLFQDEMPTAFSRVITSIPAFAYLSYKAVTSDILETDSSYKKEYRAIYNANIYSFTLRNIHSFRPEPLMNSLSDNLERVEFSLSPYSFLHSSLLSNRDKMEMQNWALLASRYFGYQCGKPIESANRLIDSVNRLTDKKARISALCLYIQKNITYNGEQTFFCDSVEGCYTSRSGSSAEMNILLLNLLRKAGINCMPLLVSTQINGNPDRDFPSISQFNGVDVMIRDSSLFYIIDCTQKYLSFQIPPYNVLNSNAFLVDPVYKGWFFIQDSRILRKNETIIDAVMDSSGNVSGTANLREIGFAKKEALEQMDNKDESEDGGASKKSEIPGLDIDSVNRENTTDRGDTLATRIRFHYRPTNSGLVYFVSPLLFFNFKKNPFMDSVRYSDVDFGCNQSFATRMKISLPGNFLVENLPSDQIVRKQDSSISFERKVFMEGGFLVIEYTFLLKSAIFIKEDYTSLKSFFDKFYATLNEDIPVTRRR